ncbi:MAG: YIP1 family protein, partial [Rubrobacter sp.]|nr:YIP1 family protein [Rubrobacter sp.]
VSEARGRVDLPATLRQALRPAKGFAETVTEVALRPAAFFARIAGGKGVMASLLFAAACATISTAAAELATLTGLSGDWQGPGYALEIAGIGAGLWLAFVVLFTGVLHLLVRLLAGSGSRGIGTTAKIVGYSSTAQLASWLPYIGWLFDLYFLYLLMIGVKEAHRASEDRAIIVILIPMFVIFLAILVISIAGIRGSMRLVG